MNIQHLNAFKFFYNLNNQCTFGEKQNERELKY